MNTRLLMASSALFMGVLGLGASFLPHEILETTHTQSSPLIVLMVQIGGALYLGFAILNWMAKANLIGGIYSRPVALGNFVHFLVVALALAKLLIAGQSATWLFIGIVLYLIFAVAFGKVVFLSPVK